MKYIVVTNERLSMTYRHSLLYQSSKAGNEITFLMGNPSSKHAHPPLVRKGTESDSLSFSFLRVERETF